MLMVMAVQFVALVLALPAFVFAAFLALETALAVIAGRTRDARRAPPGPLAVVIPAHNESAGLAATLENVKAQLREGDRLIVVADNCTDDTAAVARRHGATCLERDDPARRGKGYALQFALDALAGDPPDIVVFIDADCLLSDKALLTLAASAAGEARPVQALYLMQAPADASPRLRVAEFAWLFMNRVRMIGLQRLFDVTRFTGAGLALPWASLSSINLASGEIVEDIALTFDLIRNGHPPRLETGAVVTSVFPQDETAQVKQAARWSIGSLTYAARAGLPQLLRGIAGGRPRLVGAALDVMTPPLVLFVLYSLAALAASALAWMLGSAAPFALAASALALIGASVAAGWARFGREALPPSALAGVFRFVLMKFSVFGSKGRASARTWTPTRGGDQDDAAR